MADEKKDSKFAEVHVPQARARGKGGKFLGLGTSVEDPDVREVRRALKQRDYRRFLESVEPLAMRTIEQALRNKGVPAREKLQAAQDLLNRLHGRATGPSDASEAKKKVEQMSNDELRDFVKQMARESGLLRVFREDNEAEVVREAIPTGRGN